MPANPFDSVKGFGVTFKQIFKKPITQQYPEYKRPVYPRYRGRHRLNRHENGLEKCVGCSLCAAACPADCIRVVPAENTPDNRVSAGERYARTYRGQALLAQGQGAQAEAAFTRALAIAREIGNPPQLWKTYQALGALYESQADLERARAVYQSALDVIDGVAERLQDQELQRTFLAARPVQEIRERLTQVSGGRQ